MTISGYFNLDKIKLNIQFLIFTSHRLFSRSIAIDTSGCHIEYFRYGAFLSFQNYIFEKTEKLNGK